MPVPLPAGEVAVGDYSYDYGTVKQVRKQYGDAVEITFGNGDVIVRDKDDELPIEQGGRFSG